MNLDKMMYYLLFVLFVLFVLIGMILFVFALVVFVVLALCKLFVAFVEMVLYMLMIVVLVVFEQVELFFLLLLYHQGLLMLFLHGLNLDLKFHLLKRYLIRMNSLYQIFERYLIMYHLIVLYMKCAH